MPGRIESLLGLGRRAGLVLSGDQRVWQALRDNRAQAILLATDAGEAVKRKFARLAAQKEIRAWLWGEKETLGRIIGESPRAVVAITDRQMALQLGRLLDEQGGGASEQ